MSSAFIYTSSAISTQDKIGEKDFLDKLKHIEENKVLAEPDYREFINPMMMRRMSKSTKMSIACAFSCLKNVSKNQLDAIIIGTGLGALADTEKFLTVSTTTEERILSPTSFIQSGHNSIAGQIALLLKNDCYNMTHVLHALSFEHALLDSMLNITEGRQQVLVGAVDELTPLVKDLAVRFLLPNQIKYQLSEGAGFFIMGPDKTRAIAEVKSVSMQYFDNLADCVSSFLKDNHLGFDDIQKGFVGYNLMAKNNQYIGFDTLCYTDYTGRYFSSSAFGLHIASRYLQAYAQTGSHSLVINVASKNRVGLTLLKRV